MTVKDLHFSALGTFKSQELLQTLSPYFLILVFMYL